MKKDKPIIYTTEQVQEIEKVISALKKEISAKEKIMEDIITTHVITEELRNAYRNKWNRC